MITYYALEQSFVYSHYDDGGSGSYETIIGIDTDKDRLRERWNQHCASKNKPDDRTPLYPFPNNADKVNYRGGTGGGYASAHYYLKIIPFRHFDTPKEANT